MANRKRSSLKLIQYQIVTCKIMPVFEPYLNIQKRNPIKSKIIFPTAVFFPEFSFGWLALTSIP